MLVPMHGMAFGMCKREMPSAESENEGRFGVLCLVGTIEVCFDGWGVTRRNSSYFGVCGGLVVAGTTTKPRWQTASW